MDTWDEEKLRTVVLSKTGNPRTTTDVSSIILVLTLSPPFSSVYPIDRMQTFHSGDRDTEIRLVLGMPQW